MNYLSIFIISFTIALSGALIPGPLLTTVIAESSRRGFKTGPLMILGHALTELAMVGLIIFSAGRFTHNPLVFKTISMVGALIFLYFGCTMLLSLSKLSLDFKESAAKPANLVILGMGMSIANPYFTFWWLTIGLGLLLAAQKTGIVAIAVFFVSHILADLAWYSAVSFSISKSKKFIPLKIYKDIILVCAVVLIGFGIYFGISSFETPN